MNYRLVITPEAIGDLDDIFAFIVRDNPRAAARLVQTLRDRIRTLTRFPRRCALAPEHGMLRIGEIRHLLYGNYRIIFGIEGRAVVILEVRHSARHPSLTD